MKKIENVTPRYSGWTDGFWASWLPCPRCGLMPPDPDPRWLGARAGTCPCWPDAATTAALSDQVRAMNERTMRREQHARAVRRAQGFGGGQAA